MRPLPQTLIVAVFVVAGVLFGALCTQVAIVDFRRFQLHADFWMGVVECGVAWWFGGDFLHRLAAASTRTHADIIDVIDP